MTVRLKRAYDPPGDGDGLRVLVDRLWPRGLAKAEAHVDFWAREVAPSTALRRWFGHDPARWSEFQSRYEAELSDNRAALASLRTRIGASPATLLYAGRDSEHTHAIVLARALERLAE
ncbi:DUF488 domain-containing protein [Labrys monachus]|uniref:Uncharacterized protein YeaO (DUF488 family) n=1 Tax=Labrys monachus TaxID=217067 RepID=A0ABU0FPG0_9HYPH|nr:DUF488 family protein [Labrys monachus]MDQ0396500.1 uncharacterized protein YeaO (DUF488 family) [Labrys monachus]